MKDKTLIFIYGIPRSGTTVLQRLLASGDNVLTQDETWLIPRLINNEVNPFASPSNYGTAINASNRFVKDLDKFLFDLACDLLLERTTEKLDIVVEKTPRNYLYLDLFYEREANYIGIVRRPTDILNSFFREFLFSTFRGIIDYEIDIVLAPNIMAGENVKHRSLIVKYEELQEAWLMEKLGDYVNIKLNPTKLVILDGTIGDKNQEVELKLRNSGDLDGIDSYVKKVFTKYVIRKYFLSYCREFDYPILDEIERLDDSEVSWGLRTNFRDLFWLGVFITQKVFYRLYRYSRKTTNLSQNHPCS